MIKITLRNELIVLETELKQLDYWQRPQPEPEAFMSEAPFAYDTMDFAHWLQWLFLPQMHALLDGNYPLPPKSDIAPLAEEFVKQEQLTQQRLVSILKKIDELINELGEG